MNPLLAKERLSTHWAVPPWVRCEHLARYRFCTSYVVGKRVVDCACGEGIGSELFAVSGATAVEAFDSSGETITAARARHAQPNLRFQVADALRLPLPNQWADLYVALETIEHLEDDAQFLEEARRVLKPDGIFICSTPNRAVTNPGTTLAQRPWNRFHTREYTEEEFFDRLGRAFEQIERYGQNRQSPKTLRAISGTAAIVPPRWVVWMIQLRKAPRWLFDRDEYHAVEPLVQGQVDEYLLAVCRGPRVGSDPGGGV